MVDYKAFLAGFVLTSEDKFWDDRFSRYAPSPQLLQNGSYRVRIFNGNWDAKKCDFGVVSGICDGLPLESAIGLLQQNISDRISLTSGVAAYWDSQNEVLTLISSPCSSRKIFYRTLSNGIVFSSDLRFLITDDDRVDPVGASQLIAYGSTGANRSIFSGISMIGLGMASRFSFTNNSISNELVPVLRYGFEDAMRPVENEESYIENIHRGLQQTLASISKHKIALLLSGGLDSGLIAYILKEIGAKDVQLFTCGFNDNDVDIQYASILADKLGFTHKVILFAEKEAYPLLDECVCAYSFPFGDYSTLPSYFLIKKVAQSIDHGTYLIDGTAGDALFGFDALSRLLRNRLLWQFPNCIKKFSNLTYWKLGFWKYNNALSRLLALVGSNFTVDPILMGIMITRCAGHLNTGKEEILHAGQELVSSAGNIFFESKLSNKQRLTALDYINTCGSQYAAKVSDPARRLGCAVEFPFMWPIITQIGLDFPFKMKLYHGQIKYPLKKLIARYDAGEDYVNRPKIGFTPPFNKWLQQRGFNQWFQKAVAERCLLSDILCRIPIDEMVKAALNNPHDLPACCYHLIWIVAVTEKWFADARHSFIN